MICFSDTKWNACIPIYDISDRCQSCMCWGAYGTSDETVLSGFAVSRMHTYVLRLRRRPNGPADPAVIRFPCAHTTLGPLCISKWVFSQGTTLTLKPRLWLWSCLTRPSACPFIFSFVLGKEFFYVPPAGKELLSSSRPPALATQVLGPQKMPPGPAAHLCFNPSLGCKGTQLGPHTSPM